ncbi:MAG: hypothetical protein HYV42_03320 [Candidatus Magasanikbacteria bacterium]|nr:hypothetical protein [Candidatus Magasanikbacteria bacterium]
MRGGLWTNTVKYYRLAIKEFLPVLNELKNKNSADAETIKKLNDLIEIYDEIAAKIDRYNLNLEDPNRSYADEPDKIDLNLDERMIEHFSRLALRLLEVWKNRKNEIENKPYLTEKNEDEFYTLKELIWPLEAQFNNQSMLFFKHKNEGALKFPGEEKQEIQKTKAETPQQISGIFPDELIVKLPKDIQILCAEFNFNYKNRKPNACILLLRRILPLSIVRKFQILDEENEIKVDGNYLETRSLVGKAEKILKSKKIYQTILNFKLVLDSSQHSYTLNVTIMDAEGAGVAIRVFLEDLFSLENNE